MGLDPTKNVGTVRYIYWRRMDPTKNGGTVRILIGGDWIQLKTVVLSEYLLEETGYN